MLLERLLFAKMEVTWLMLALMSVDSRLYDGQVSGTGPVDNSGTE